MTHTPDPNHNSARLIVLVGFDGAAALDVTGPHEVFAMASRLAGERLSKDCLVREEAEPPYRIVVLAGKAGPFRAASGISLVADESWREFQGHPDTLLVAGGPDMSPLVGDGVFLDWLRAMSGRVRRIGSVCTGAFALAEAGLLDHRRATTHWQAADCLQQTYPHVSVETDAIYVRDGDRYTSAGVTAGMDLALALVEEDLGREAALAVARMLVLFLKRPGGQSQFSAALLAQGAEGKRLAPVLSWLAGNYRKPLTVEAMAARAAMSPRSFSRAFLAETGVTPARFLERLRMEQAVRLLEAGDVAIEAAARECGFNGCEQMRRAFLRRLGVTPLEYQQRFRSNGAATNGEPHYDAQNPVPHL